MMSKNKIIFHLTNDKTAEVYDVKEPDIKRLVSQFNNGHLMDVANICINPRELIAFIVEGMEEVEWCDILKFYVF